jgi:hypothetical protein
MAVEPLCLVIDRFAVRGNESSRKGDRVFPLCTIFLHHERYSRRCTNSSIEFNDHRLLSQDSRLHKSWRHVSWNTSDYL